MNKSYQSLSWLQEQWKAFNLNLEVLFPVKTGGGSKVSRKALWTVNDYPTIQKPLFWDLIFVKRYIYSSDFLKRHIALTTYALLVHKKAYYEFSSWY